MIRLTCPTCKQLLEIEDEGIGLVQPCPACGAQVTVSKPTPTLRIVNQPPVLIPPAAKSRSTAVQAGWICLAIATVVFTGSAIWLHRHTEAGPWVLYAALPFFAVTIICAVVAMCANQLLRGLALLTAAVIVCAVGFKSVAKDFQRANEKAVQDMLPQVEQQMQELLKGLSQ